MIEIGDFRGIAGEVTRGIIQSNTFLTVFGVCFYFLVIMLSATLLHYLLPSFIIFFMAYWALAILVGKLALSSAREDVHSGLLSPKADFKESVDFANRHFLYTLMWGLPLFLLGWLLSGDLLHLLISFKGGQMSFITLGLTGFFFTVLLFTMLVAPVFTTLLASYTESYQDVLSIEPLQWLMKERGSDLIPLFVTFFGGIFVFFLVYSIPAALVILVAFQISFSLGTVIAGLFYLIPSAITLILLGRLSGAFLLAEKPTEPEATEPVAPPIEPKPNTIETYISTSESLLEEQPLMQVSAIFDAVEKMRINQINQAVIKGEKMQPDDRCIYNTIELAFLYLKSDREKMAATQVEIALPQLLALEQYQEAINLFIHFKDYSSTLELEAKCWEELSHALTRYKAYKEASHCLYEYIKHIPEAEKLTIQKQMLSIADAASSHEAPEDAFYLYVNFMKHFSHSTLSTYAEEAAKRENQRLKKQKLA